MCFIDKLGAILADDPGGRGLAGRAPKPDLRALADELLSAEKVLVVTGFCIPDAGVGETDGPGGAVNIARALIRMGKTVGIVTDSYSYKPVEAAALLYAKEAEIICIPMEGAQDACLGLLQEWKPSHVIAIERPGKSRGHYHNMRGQIIDNYVADTDILLSNFSGVTIAVGDGGNELGMGSLRDYVHRYVAYGEVLCADVGCHYPMVAGISNWWGWGICALLDEATGLSLLPTDKEEYDLLQAIVGAGAVDGVTKRQELTVDGLSFEDNMAILNRLRQLVSEYKAAKNRSEVKL